MKVYCIECKYFNYEYVDYEGTTQEVCNSPDNLTDTYKQRNGAKNLIPSVKNINNNCKDFKRREGI